MVQTIAISAGVILLVLNQLGLLNWLKPKSASDVAAELELGDRRERRLEAKIVERDRLIVELRQQRTNEPVLEILAELSRQLAQSAESQAAVIERLAKHNGSFTHMEESMREIRESLKLLAGFVVGVTDIPTTTTHP